MDIFRLYITSAQRYIRPSILRTYPHVVGPLNCKSGTYSIEKKVSLSDHTADRSVAHFCRLDRRTFVGRMH